MPNFFRNLFIAQTETKEEFHLRMEELHQHLDDLSKKQPDEVAGDPEEAICYGMKMSYAFRDGNETEARHFLSEMLRVAPNQSGMRLAAAAHLRLGEEAESLAQLGIALGLDPKNFAIHSMMARRLSKRGERQAAEAVLNQGWIHHQKVLPKNMHEASRKQYFSILENQKGEQQSDTK